MRMCSMHTPKASRRHDSIVAYCLLVISPPAHHFVARERGITMSRQKKIFGTDGVRGTANVEPITAGTALQLGQAAAYVFKHLESESRGRGKHKIVIEKDTRLS